MSEFGPDITQRAQLLFEQKRYDLAVTELRRCLVAEPDNLYAHILLSECFCGLQQLPEALAEAREAVRIGPDRGLAYRAYAYVLIRQDRTKEAEAAIANAVALEPFDPGHLNLLSYIRLERGNWAGALDAAERGLVLQADSVSLVNARSRALIKLGRADEALAAVDFALRLGPDNAFSHASKGWALLESGQTLPALEHFREALRIDPNLEWARSGMLTALKSRYRAYRVVLAYYFWMGRLPRQLRVGIIVGFWVLSNLLRSVAASHPSLSPYIFPISAAYLIFCFATWTIDPLFNTMLRFSSFGKYLLKPAQVVTSNLVAAFFLGAIVCLAVYVCRPTGGWEMLSFGFALCAAISAGTAKARARLSGRIRPIVEIAAPLFAVLLLVLLSLAGGL